MTHTLSPGEIWSAKNETPTKSGTIYTESWHNSDGSLSSNKNQDFWNENLIVETSKRTAGAYSPGQVTRIIKIGQFDWIDDPNKEIPYNGSYYKETSTIKYILEARYKPEQVLSEYNTTSPARESLKLKEYRGDNHPYDFGLHEDDFTYKVSYTSSFENNRPSNCAGFKSAADSQCFGDGEREEAVDSITKTNNELGKFIQDQWWEDPFDIGNLFSVSSEETPKKSNEFTITASLKFNKKSADKITNFNPSTDTLEIDTASFDIDSSATFASGKNKKAVKKKLAKQDFDFLYDEKKGGLYFNENGVDKGFGEGGIIAILKGAPDLTSDNLEFI